MPRCKARSPRSAVGAASAETRSRPCPARNTVPAPDALCEALKPLTHALQRFVSSLGHLLDRTGPIKTPPLRHSTCLAHLRSSIIAYLTHTQTFLARLNVLRVFCDSMAAHQGRLGQLEQRFGPLVGHLNAAGNELAEWKTAFMHGASHLEQHLREGRGGLSLAGGRTLLSHASNLCKELSSVLDSHRTLTATYVGITREFQSLMSDFNTYPAYDLAASPPAVRWREGSATCKQAAQGAVALLKRVTERLVAWDLLAWPEAEAMIGRLSGGGGRAAEAGSPSSAGAGTGWRAMSAPGGNAGWGQAAHTTGW